MEACGESEGGLVETDLAKIGGRFECIEVAVHKTA